MIQSCSITSWRNLLANATLIFCKGLCPIGNPIKHGKLQKKDPGSNSGLCICSFPSKVHHKLRSTGGQTCFFRFAKQIGERNNFKTFFNSFALDKTLFTIKLSLRLFIYHCNSKEKIIHYGQTFRQFEPLFLNWSNVGGHIRKLDIFTYFTKFFWL